MTGDVTYKHGKFHLVYEYENLKDHVQPEQMAEYIQGLKNKDENFSYLLRSTVDGKPLPEDNASDDKKSDVPTYISLVILAFIGFIAWKAKR